MHFIDNHINFRRLFAEAIRENIADHYDRSLIQPGYFRIRLGRDRPLVAARIYERPPDDGDSPVGEVLGKPCDPVFVWSGCDRETLVPPNDGRSWSVDAYYRYLCDTAEWAKVNAPQDPIADPRRKVDLKRLPPIAPP